MRRNFAFVSMLLTALVPACGGTTGNVSAPPVRAVIVFVTPSPTPPPTATLTPTSTEVAVVVTTPAVLAEATDPIEPKPTASPTQTATSEPTPTATPEPDWLNTVGRTGDQLVYLGNPDAAVMLIDYSDFL